MAGTARKILRLVDKGLGPATIGLLAAHDRLRRGRGPTAVAAASAPPAGILVIKLVGLGDTVLMLTPLRRLRECFPKAKITALVTPLSAGILSGQPALDEVIVFDALHLGRSPAGAARLVRDLRARRFDCVIDFEQHFQLSAALAYLTGAARRIGFSWNRDPRGKMFTDPVSPAPDDHMVESFSRLLEPLGVAPRPIEALEEIATSLEDRTRVDRWLADRGIGRRDLVVAVHPGSGPRAPHRRWDKAKFAEITRRLGADLGAKVVLTGTAEERALVQEVMAMAATPGVFNAGGEFTVAQMAALAKRCGLVLSNDTGTMHVAAAMGVPTVGLFGPESPRRYGPFGRCNRSVYKHLACSPCIEIHRGRHRKCGDPQCIADIAVEEVWAVIQEYGLETSAAGQANDGRWR
ncbi:MAG: glycosyltransferase family 9 protein [bacterium]